MKKYQGSCHCNAVQFEITSTLAEGIMCDCSICRRKGAIMVPVDEGDFHLLSGAQALNCYKFHTHNARHYFCRDCGIYTHHKRRRDDKFAVNLGCLEKVRRADLGSVVLFEGRKLT